jgi:hypothetical protein
MSMMPPGVFRRIDRKLLFTQVSRSGVLGSSAILVAFTTMGARRSGGEHGERRIIHGS